MCELRDRRAHRLEQEDVLGGVGEVVLAADHVADRHGGVVDGHREVVQGRAVRPKDDEVAAQSRSIDLNVPPNDVVEGDRPIRRNAEAHHRPAPLGLEGASLRRREMSAAAAVSDRLACGLLAPSLGLELARCAVAVVGLVLRKQPGGGLFVALQALHLAIRTV